MDPVLSSPDPLTLNNSATYQSPTKPRRTSRARRSVPLEGSSPKKQTFELDVGYNLSPHKLKVTVEAGNSDKENDYKYFNDNSYASPSPFRRPMNCRRERTTTTIVPLKGLSDSEAEDLAIPKRGRGRPRNSASTPVPVKKRGRASTPTQKAKARKKSTDSLAEGDSEHDLDFLLDNGVEVGRGKGRSGSRSRKGTSRKSTPGHTSGEPLDKNSSSTMGKRARERRKTLMPTEVVVLEDETGVDVIENEAPNAADVSGALLQNDGNSGDSTSAYSTIRSTTTAGYSEPDITIARFDPGNETPRTTGWSSPRAIEVPRHSNAHRCRSYRSSPSMQSARRTKSYYGEEDVAVIPVLPGIGKQNQNQQYGDHKDDGNDTIREFDTILESEGFSMISVDTVPSFRDHMSSPANIIQGQQSPSYPGNKNISAVQELDGTGKDDSFSSIPEEVLKAATPGRKHQNSNLLSGQNLRADDSFSSIPPEVLEAATPAGKSTRSRLLAAKQNRVEDAASNVASRGVEVTARSQELPKLTPDQGYLKDREAYEDSFSAIPSAILDAATPGPARKVLPSTRVLDQSRSCHNISNVSVPSHGLPTVQRHEQSSISTRLPTPEDTPSPPGEAPNHLSSAPGKQTSPPLITVPADTASGTESSFSFQMRSSPPSVATRRYTYTAHLRQQRDLFPDKTQTPPIVFSSPSLPPPIQIAKGHPGLSGERSEEQRTKLSPTVRAGRVLQDILVPSSPRGRSQSLGSPFKSPVVHRKLSSSGAKQTSTSSNQARQADPLARINIAEPGNLFSTSPQHNDRGILDQIEDPFGNGAEAHARSPSPEEKQGYALELPAQRHISGPRSLLDQSENSVPRNDDDMSWQADEEFPLNGSGTSSVNRLNLSSNLRASIVGAEKGYSPDRDSTGVSERRWAAQRHEVKRQMESANPSQIVVIDTEIKTADGQDHNDDEDFGLLLETLNSSSPVQQPQTQHRVLNDQKPRRSKIPSPWRKNSKRLAYSDELSLLSSPSTEAKPSVSKQSFENDLEMDLSEFLIPQKANFRPRVRQRANIDLSALLASSPNKIALPVLTNSFQKPSFLKPESSPRNVTTVGEDNDIGCSQVHAPVLEPNPEQIGFKPQVMVRDIEQSLLAFSPVESQPPALVDGMIVGNPFNKGNVMDQQTPEYPSSSSELKPLGISWSARPNALPAATRQDPPAQVSPSACTSDSNSPSIFSLDEEEHQAIKSRTLKWTQSVPLAPDQVHEYTSPTKSCLRSPVKTPSAGSEGGSRSSPTKNVKFVSSSPIPSSPTEPLSSKTWSRDHWTFLDSILQAWKPENQKDGPDQRRRNSTRVISRLLGKNVSFDGKKMKLQQWHLEVVDEFRGYVSGWQEADIAKRVFALLVGEERRGLVTNGTREEVRGGPFQD